MTKETTCCFTGPRPKNLPMNGDEKSQEIVAIKENLLSAVEEAYSDGYRSFISGMAEGFDLFAAEAVLMLKEKYSDIRLICAFPCPEIRDERNSAIRKRTEDIVSRAQLVVYVEKKYSFGCEHRRNIYMVNNSFRIIGYYDGLSGGTAHCFEYALAQGIETKNLY